MLPVCLLWAGSGESFFETSRGECSGADRESPPRKGKYPSLPRTSPGRLPNHLPSPACGRWAEGGSGDGFGDGGRPKNGDAPCADSLPDTCRQVLLRVKRSTGRSTHCHRVGSKPRLRRVFSALPDAVLAAAGNAVPKARSRAREAKARSKSLGSGAVGLRRNVASVDAPPAGVIGTGWPGRRKCVCSLRKSSARCNRRCQAAAP